MHLSSICAAFVLVWTSCVAKIYNKCELARELKNFDLPDREIPTWVCIAKHESLFDTAAMNHGSGDHGLFQISQQYWCSPPGFGCNKRCTAFRDDDIADDVECIRRIFNEHQRLSGDGFNAWVVYPLYCKGDNSPYLEGCSDVDGEAVNATENQIPTEEPFVDGYGDGYEFPPLPSPQRNEVPLAVKYRNEEKNSADNAAPPTKTADTFSFNDTSKPTLGTSKAIFVSTTVAPSTKMANVTANPTLGTPKASTTQVTTNGHQFITTIPPRKSTIQSTTTSIPSVNQFTFSTYFPSWFQKLPPAKTITNGHQFITTIRPRMSTIQSTTTQKPFYTTISSPVNSTRIPSGKQLTFPTYFPSWFQTLPPAPPRPTRRTTKKPGTELATMSRPGLGQQTTRRPFVINRPGFPLLSGGRPFNQRPWRPFGTTTTSKPFQLGSGTQSFGALRFEDNEPDIMLGSEYVFHRTQFGYRLYRTV